MPKAKQTKPYRIPNKLLPLLKVEANALNIGLIQLRANCTFPPLDRAARTMARIEITAEDKKIIEDLHRVHKKSRTDIIGAALYWAQHSKALPAGLVDQL